MTNDIATPYNAGVSRTESNKDKTDNVSSPQNQMSSKQNDSHKGSQTSDIEKVADQTLTKFSDITKSAGKYAKEKPLVVAGIALAVGFLLGSRRR